MFDTCICWKNRTYTHRKLKVFYHYKVESCSLTHHRVVSSDCSKAFEVRCASLHLSMAAVFEWVPTVGVSKLTMQCICLPSSKRPESCNRYFRHHQW